MKYKFLGNTGLVVSELCFGTMTFGGGGFWEAIGNQQQGEVNELMKVVIESGITFIDTANVYSHGNSEILLGNALKELKVNRHNLVLATKVRGRMGPGQNNVGLSRYHILQSVDESLQRLQTDHIDILYAHGVDPKTPLEETMKAFNDVVEAGKVRYIGICNWPAWMVMKAQGIALQNRWSSIKALQYYYSIAGRDIEREIVPLALDQQFGIMPWSPLAGGFLSGKYTRSNLLAGDSRRDNFDFPPVNKEKAYDIIDVMLAIGKEHGVSAAQVALAWIRQQAHVTSIIIGAKNPVQLQDNIKSTNLILSTEELQKLDQISDLPKEYPGWMVERQSKDRNLNQL